MSTVHLMHSPAALFQAALAAHQQGRLDDAQACYLRILQVDSGHAEAVHMLGIFHLQRREPAEAEKRIRQGLALEEKVGLFALVSEPALIPAIEAGRLAPDGR